MTTAFAAQLSEIAAKSSDELDLKAQKAAYSESLIFEKKVAGSQDIETVYQICVEGFRDLCQLDPQFVDFERNLFSRQSKSQDRKRMTSQENEALDAVIEHFFGFVGSRLLLRPAIKAVEWLVRRFRVHEYNTSFVLSTFLPYHETPIFRNLLSILPKQLPAEYKFLGPYLQTATNPPRHAIVYNATNSDALFTALNSSTVKICQDGAAYPTLLSFWSGIILEAVVGRLSLAQSGRKEVQQQRQEDVLLKVLPLLNDGFAIHDVPELLLACYTITIILASKGDVGDNVLNALMEAVAGTIQSVNGSAALVCLIILASRKIEVTMPKKVLRAVIQVTDIEVALQNLAQMYPAEYFVRGLVKGALASLKKTNYSSHLMFVEKLIKTSVTFPSGCLTGQMLADAVEKSHALDCPDPIAETIRAHLVDMLRRLNDTEAFSATSRQLMNASGADTSDFEALIGTVVSAQVEQPALSEASSTMDVDMTEPSDAVVEVLNHLPERTVGQHSFMTSTGSHLFAQLSHAFQVCCAHQTGLSLFENLPVWQAVEPGSPLYLSFLVRVACGPQSTQCRSSALRLIARNLASQKNTLDAQALIPYIVVCLADPSQGIRRSAAEVLIAISDALPRALPDSGSNSRWGASNLYDTERAVSEDQWLLSSQVRKIIQTAFMPVLEECILDHAQVGKTLQNALTGGSSTVRVSPHTESVDLKKSQRLSLFNLLTTHLLATPLYRVKTELVRLLDGVDRLSSTTSKTKTLMPLLHTWFSFDSSAASKLAAAERLPLPDIDSTFTLIVSASGGEALLHLLSAVTDVQVQPRPELVEAVLERIVSIWKDLKPEKRSLAVTRLFELSASGSHLTMHGASQVLRNVPLPTDALIQILAGIRDAAASVKDNPPSRKRRRTSHGQAPVALADGAGTEIEATIAKLTFALELVDGSKPENHPELLKELFEDLALLQLLRRFGQGQLPYLLHLCLSSLLAIIRSTNTAKAKVDSSAVRVDLVTECVRVAENPQVQNTALLLVAALATSDPEHVLHNVMPIFTFMGNSVLAKDDEHSAHVINQIIDQIIPPLVSAVRKRNEKDIIRPLSDLLSSFVAAFGHIPQHRRIGLFHRLVSRLGPANYCFALVGMLATSKPDSSEVTKFVADLMNRLDPIEQTITYSKVLALVGNVFSAHPDDAETIARINASSSAEEKREVIQILLATAVRLMRGKALKAQMQRIDSLKADMGLRLREQLKIDFEQVLRLVRDLSGDPVLKEALTECLDAFLTLPPLAEYFTNLPSVLAEVEPSIRSDVLRALESRLSGNPPRDTTTQVAAIAFLPSLTRLLEGGNDISLKIAAIACIDRISEHYGRKNIPAILESSRIISQQSSLDSNDSRLRIASTLCIASIVEIVKEAIIPVVPEILPTVLHLLEQSLAEDEEDESLHNSCFSLLLAMVSHVSFMLSEEHLDRISVLSAESASTELEAASEQVRKDFLSFLARKVGLRQVFGSAARTWSVTVENGLEAVLETLDMLGNSIKHSTKTVVMKGADDILGFILQVSDLRRVQFTVRTEDSYTDEEVDQIESKLNELTIKFVYKVNDNIFRPLLGQWVEWAIECAGVEMPVLAKAKMLRRTSLFRFLTHFFTTLKSIVTSYASYVLEAGVDVLKHAASLADKKSSSAIMDTDQTSQYLSALSMIQSAASYDQDSFFASPSHFSPLAESLISQLKLAAHRSVQPHLYTHVIPCVIAIAAAVVDNPEHHTTMNKQLCQLRHAESKDVRMASIKTQMALSQSDEVGEEWVGNVVGAGETIVYVNEMLEDDDEAVEGEVRSWVRRVREMVGEDVFET